MKNDPSQLIFNFNLKAECEMAVKRLIFKQKSPKKPQQSNFLCVPEGTFRDPVQRKSKNIVILPTNMTESSSSLSTSIS